MPRVSRHAEPLQPHGRGDQRFPSHRPAPPSRRMSSASGGRPRHRPGVCRSAARSLSASLRARTTASSATSPGQLAAIFGIGAIAKLECVEHEIIDLMNSTHRPADGLRGRGALHLVNTHLHHPVEAEPPTPKQAVPPRLADRQELPTVLSGDFNSYEGERLSG